MTSTLRRHVVGALALAAASVGFSSYAEAGKIRLGFTTWVGYGPLFLAQ